MSCKEKAVENLNSSSSCNKPEVLERVTPLPSSFLFGSTEVSKTASEPTLRPRASKKAPAKEIPKLRLVAFQTFFLWKHWLCFLFYISCSAFTAYFIQSSTPSPYMDEIFHIEQAQRFCQDLWYPYHPKLTTPPGLYIFSQPFVRWLNCEVGPLRAVNYILGAISYWVGAILINSLQSTQNFSREILSSQSWSQPLGALAAALSPVGFFFHHIYYTDSASNLAILLGFLLSFHRHHWLSALVGIFSLSIRQTNIVWVIFFLCWSILSDLARRAPNSTLAHSLNAPPSLADELTGLLFAPRPLLMAIRQNFVSLVFRVGLPYTLVLATFASFLVWNGGIVLGDKANHIATFHVPQLGYYLVFCTGLLWIHLLDETNPLILLTQFLSWLKQVLSSFVPSFVLILTLTAITLAIHGFTVHHPFILSDNRHITFYLWKNLFRAHPLLPYAYVPIYLMAGWLWVNKIVLISHKPLTLWLGYLLVVILTLVPTPLLELRYFLPHISFLRLCLMSTRPSRTYFEIVFYLLLHSFILYRFVYCPFTWDSEPGKVQRLMW